MGFSEVLGTVQNALFRKALTRLRLSSHHLKIETSRWHKPHPIARNKRLCQMCNVLEDEYHLYVNVLYRMKSARVIYLHITEISPCMYECIAKFVFKPCTLYARTFENASFCCKTHKGLWPYVEIE